MQARVTGTPERANSPKEIFTPLAAASSTTMIPARLSNATKSLENPVPSASAAPSASARGPVSRKGASSITAGLLLTRSLATAPTQNSVSLGDERLRQACRRHGRVHNEQPHDQKQEIAIHVLHEVRGGDAPVEQKEARRRERDEFAGPAGEDEGEDDRQRHRRRFGH